MEVTKPAERLQKVCELFNTNPKRLADDMGLSSSTVYSVTNGHTKDLSFKMIDALLEIYPTLSKDYLVGISTEPIKKEEMITPSTAAMILRELEDIKKMLLQILDSK